MSDQDDSTLQGFVIALVLGVVAAVVAGVLVLAGSTLLRDAGRTASAAASAPAAGADAMGAVEKLYFAVDSASLPPEAGEVVARVGEAARANAAAIVLISGYHDETGDPAHNADLAKRRALAVRDALQAAGVAPSQLEMAKPAVTTGGGDAREARRVELRLQ